MNKNNVVLGIVKIFGALLVIFIVIIFIIYKGTFSTLSPDSIRFMHIWQINADQFINSGSHFSDAIKLIYDSFRSSSNYDMGRGRLTQYVFYGFEGLFKSRLFFSSINFLMILLTLLNSALISWLATKYNKNLSSRLDLFLICWLILITTSFVISPVMLVILYSKYIWFTFILAFFVAHQKKWKTAFLIAAAFSDEIGLFAVMLIMFLMIVRFCLNYDFGNSKAISRPIFRIARAFLYGVTGSLSFLFIFYGILAIFLRIVPYGFLSFSTSIGGGLLTGAELTGKFFGFFRYSEMLVLGATLGCNLITILLGISILILIILGIRRRIKETLWSKCVEHFDMNDMIYKWLSDEKGFSYIFWVIMLLLQILILPSDKIGLGGDNHYVFGPAVVLAILFIMSLQDLLTSRNITIVLIGILAVHLISFPHTISKTSEGLERYLFPDKTVTSKDIGAINRCVRELRNYGRSTFFETFNNDQEIDFSGTWYYSKIKAFNKINGYYFPIEGTVRVLLWPDKIEVNESIRPTHLEQVQ